MPDCHNKDLDPAHVIGRFHQDKPYYNEKGKKVREIRASSVISLCRHHHTLYDSYQLNILGLLTDEELQNAIEAVGEERAMIRITGTPGKSA